MARASPCARPAREGWPPKHRRRQPCTYRHPPLSHSGHTSVCAFVWIGSAEQLRDRKHKREPAAATVQRAVPPACTKATTAFSSLLARLLRSFHRSGNTGVFGPRVPACTPCTLRPVGLRTVPRTRKTRRQLRTGPRTSAYSSALGSLGRAAGPCQRRLRTPTVSVGSVRRGGSSAPHAGLSIARGCMRAGADAAAAAGRRRA